MTAANRPPRSRDETLPPRSLFVSLFLAAIFTAGIGELVTYFVGLHVIVQRYALLLNPAALWLAPSLDAPIFAAGAWATWLLVRRINPRRAAGATIGMLIFLAVFEPLLMLNSRLHLPAVALLAGGIAASLARAIEAHPTGARIWVRRWAILTGAVALSGSLAWTLWPRLNESRRIAELGPAPPGSPNVIVVVLDAVRAPAMHLYGGDRDNTRLLDSLARHGVVFDRAYTTASWTLPSHSSMFTGRYPAELAADWATPLEPGPLTLAEYFRGRGYATGGFSGNLRYVSRVFGLSRGFQHFSDYPVTFSEAVRANSLLARVAATINLLFGTHLDPGRVRAGAVVTDAATWAEGQRRPFFMFLNLFDGHESYDPPAPFDTAFTGQSRPFRNFAELDAGVRHGADSAAGMRELYRAYQAAIAYEDAALDSLLRRLERRGLLDSAIVIVTADHGDLFGEHGLVKHGDNLYSLVLHVPLVWYAPGKVPSGLRSQAAVSLRDLPRTIAELTGDTTDAFPGRSLFRPDGSVTDSGSAVLSTISHFPGGRLTGPLRRGDMASLIAGSWQYIINGDGAEELYDLRNDSLPVTNLAGQPQLSDMMDTLRATMRRLPVSGTTRRYLTRGAADPHQGAR